MSRILIIDDEESICRTLRLHLKRQGHQTRTGNSAEQGLELADRLDPQVIILDIRLCGMDGMEAFPIFRDRFPQAGVIMITAIPDVDNTILALRGGVVEFIHKPIDIGELDQAVVKAERFSTQGIADGKQAAPLASPEVSTPGFPSMVGNSGPMRQVFKTIGMVTRPGVSLPVLIVGESGTGKAMAAQVIHRSGDQSSHPFVAINCAALTEPQMHTELFGHPAPRSWDDGPEFQAGKLVAAGHGTLFLDEVGTLSPSLQLMLLRVLQDRAFQRRGAGDRVTTTCRIVAASSRELVAEVADGRFREDLLYRLSAITLKMPPLRERREDIPRLVAHFLARIAQETDCRIPHVPTNVMQVLKAAPWPGNVRQLANTLMKTVILSSGDRLELEFLPEELHHYQVFAEGNNPENWAVEDDYSLETLEKRHILQILIQSAWNKSRTCEALKISRPRLDRKIKQYQLGKPEDIK